MRGPEDRIIRNIDSNRKVESVRFLQDPKNLDRAFDEAQKYLDESAINPASFEDVFSPKMIAEHTRYVEKMQDKFSKEHESEKRGPIFEAAVLESIKRGDMFGRNSIVFKTAPYDDIAHKVDFVLERSGAPTGIAVDASTSERATIRKIEDLASEIKEGKLTEIQYFQTPNFKGRALNVPRVVLGVERDTALELDELWYGIRQGTKPASTLKQSPVRGIFIHEMLMQLKVFSAYALRNGNKIAAEAYQRSLSIVQDAVTAAKEDNVHISFTHPTDKVHLAILNSLAELK